ncbi:hypothetical protein ACTUM7_00890 [Basfia succiniciproducens]|uniref:hypothetical protein n=1 Tax=Basfia succiniciproducens TaxID=653940 RepID=UPI003FCCC7F1
MLSEQTYVASNGMPVIYKHQKSKFDFKHVIFVFSGFLNAKPGNYDFAKALEYCPADVIWISDDFKDMYTYYLCINMDFSVESAVKEFIHNKIQELNLSYENVTVTGFSKGGSAALYYGAKLPVANVVATVPQTKVGSYAEKNWKHVGEHMMGRITPAKVAYLDKLIIKALLEDENRDKNIYLLTSESDMQYTGEILPVLGPLRKYSNFNLMKTYSAFVREHNQVTSHHTALLLGIYYSLASEATPRFNQGEVNFFGKELLPPKKISYQPFVDLRKVAIKGKLLFLDGVAILRGYDLFDYADVDYELILKSSKTEIRKPLAKAHRPSLTRELFDGESFVIYDKGWFTTYQYKGLDISDIDGGKYEMFIHIKTPEFETTEPLLCKDNQIFNEMLNGRKVSLEGNKLFLSI